MKGWLTDIFSTKGMESKEGFCFQYFCLILGLMMRGSVSEDEERWKEEKVMCTTPQ